MRLPNSARRLFPEQSIASLEESTAEAFVVGRLLEEGDGEDLRRMVTDLDEAEIRQWLRRRGHRQLSRRSRAFWSLLISNSTNETEANPLWPL